MTDFWRMQLHPADPDEATKYCVESLAAGFIGLDFAEDTGDLRKIQRADLPSRQRDYIDFATRMKVGDFVLVIAHHFPFALVRVSGQYNYIAKIDSNLGIWFRHFRRVNRVHYLHDWQKDARKWSQVRMSDAISVLSDPSGKSYKLIERWLAFID